MKSLEKDVLSVLRTDCRTPVKTIARMTGATEKQVEEAVKGLEERGIIVKYAAITNDEQIDEGLVEALIEVKVTPQKGAGFDTLAEEISAHDEVKSLYLMSGGYDFAVIVEGKSLKSVSRFVSERISTYENVLSTATHFILKKYKVEGTPIFDREDDRVSVQP